MMEVKLNINCEEIEIPAVQILELFVEAFRFYGGQDKAQKHVECSNIYICKKKHGIAVSFIPNCDCYDCMSVRNEMKKIVRAAKDADHLAEGLSNVDPKMREKIAMHLFNKVHPDG